MNITSMIEQELLEAAHSGQDLDQIMHRHGRTKGPFYQALAKATATIKEELSDLSSSFSLAQRELDALREEGDSLRAERDQIQAEIEKAKWDLEAQHQQLAEIQPLLKQARELRAIGFTEKHLYQLHELLGSIAADQGALPREGISQFFATVAHYGEITSWELAKSRGQTQAKQAQSEAKRWQAESRRQEATTKARGSLISITERLLDAGVTEGDLHAWEDMLHQTDTKPEVLLEELKTFGTWEALFQQRSQQVAALETQQVELQAQVETLRIEREQVTTAIGAVRDVALKEMLRTSKKAQEAIDSLLARVEAYRELQTEAALLEAEVRLARVLTGEDEELWKQVGQISIVRLLHGAIKWSLVTDYNPTLDPPDIVCKSTLLHSYHRVPWRLLVLWAVDGFMAEIKKLALKSG